MSNIFNIQTKGGKQHGILSLYILHSLKKNPKTGIDLNIKVCRGRDLNTSLQIERHVV